MGLALEVLLPPFVACLVLTGIHTYLGLHVVSRGVIFVDLALAQIAALGATFAFLLGYDPHGPQGYVYSLTFTFIGAAIFSISRLKDQRIPHEAIIGITFAVASAASIMLADRSPQGAEFVEAMLTGALLWTPWSTILKTAVIYGLIGIFHWVYRHRFLTLSLDHQRAEAEGWNIRWWDFLFYTSFGFVITSSVAMAGILLVFSFLVIPSVIGMIFAHRISTRLIIGWVVGTVVSSTGLTLSYAFDFPSGPAVVCTFGVALVLAGVIQYLTTAERPLIAAGRVAGVSVVAAGGLWLAVNTAGLPAATPREARADTAPVGAARDPLEVARAALSRLESSTDEPPPAEAVADLLSVSDSLHQMIGTGQVVVSENAVVALNRSGRDVTIDGPLEEIAYHADDPWARLRGAEGLLARQNSLGVEPLIDLMATDTPLFLKLQAVESLRQATAQTFEFDPEAPPDLRATAVARWREWWEAHKAEPLPVR